MMLALRMMPLLAQMHHTAEAPGLISYLIAAVATLVVVWVLYLAARMTISPGETDRSHIKWTILEEEPKRKDG